MWVCMSCGFSRKCFQNYAVGQKSVLKQPYYHLQQWEGEGGGGGRHQTAWGRKGGGGGYGLAWGQAPTMLSLVSRPHFSQASSLGTRLAN